MRKNLVNKQYLETTFYATFAVLLLGIVYYLFYYDSVNYVAFITEDMWAEYGTSVCFFMTAVLLLLLSIKQGPYLPRIIWGIIGVIAFLIAGEEISWGQRIFNIETPTVIKELNFQGETTLHNMEAFRAINDRLHQIAAYLILLWLIFSMILSLRMQQLKERIHSIGIPIVPMKLIPIFLLAAFFLLFYPTAKADEVGEFFLSIAVMMWAIDLFLGHYWDKRPNRLMFLSVASGALLVATFLVICLIYVHSASSASMGWRLNKTASRDYPTFGMYEQAQVLYEYIYHHPEYIQSDTRKNYAEMLVKAGKQAEDFEIAFPENMEGGDK